MFIIAGTTADQKMEILKTGFFFSFDYKPEQLKGEKSALSNAVSSFRAYATL